MRRLALAMVVAAGVARAAAPADRPRVFIDVDACVGLDPDAVRHIAGIELGVPLADAAAANVTRVSATCEADLVALTVVDPLTGKTLSRRLDLHIDPVSARVRLLALAAVELVVASGIELQAVSPPIPAPAPPPPDPVDVVDPLLPPVRPDWSLSAFASARFAGTFTLFGGGAAVKRRLGNFWLLAVDVTVEQGDNPIASGEVGAVLATAYPRIGAQLIASDLEVDVAAGVRLGAAVLRGTPNGIDPQLGDGHLSGVWGGPALAGEIRARGNFSAAVAVEAGFTAFAIEGQLRGMTEFRLGGPWLMISIAAVAWL